VKATSFSKVAVIFLVNETAGWDSFQVGVGIIRGASSSMIQANDIVEEVGSKIENRFAIILGVFLKFLFWAEKFDYCVKI